MGIKGIYSEIGPGTRIALTKLAIETFEKKSRPLRIAIDVSIWQFQTQAGQGGTNPAIRTFYYRLLRLLSVSVQPLFVFDGPHKPKFKRNKRVGQGGAMVPNMLTKQMLKLFGFPFHMAPGEAEAECALLQREGIVDAVLSEDVDTLMFGCNTTLRNWSSEGTRGNKSPTHVSLYDAKTTKEGSSQLDREGMVLVAMMSGGDYIPEGIPGCGIKIACEVARAGFGASLCKIPKSDLPGFAAWRLNLLHEIHTNESKFFRQKHKGLNIPEDFPNKEVLGFYTHPVVSSTSKLEKLKDEIVWDGGIDVQGLRAFVGDAFEWTNRIGAVKFVRGLAPALLVHKLRMRGDRRASGYNDLVLTAINETEFVRAICGNRTHFSTDGIQELRVVYHPNEIVGLDLDSEPDDSDDIGRAGLATHEEIEMEEDGDEEQSSKRGPSQYDPTKPDKLWIPRAVAKVGVPLKVEDYEESLRDPLLFLKQRATAKKAISRKAVTNGGMPKGALDRFVRVTKPATEFQMSPKRDTTKESTKEPALPPAYLAPALQAVSEMAPQSPTGTRTRRSTRRNQEPNSNFPNTKARKTKSKVNTASQSALSPVNPWTLSQSQSTEIPKENQYHVMITKPLCRPASHVAAKSSQPTTIDLLSSSPPQPHRLSPPRQSLPSNVSLPATTFNPLRSKIPSGRGSPVENLEDDLQLSPLPGTVTRTHGSKRTGSEDVPSLETMSDNEEKISEPYLSPSPSKRRSPISMSHSSYTTGNGSRGSVLISQTVDDEPRKRVSTASESTLESLDTPATPGNGYESPRRMRKLDTQVIDLSSSPLPLSPTLSTSYQNIQEQHRDESEISVDSLAFQAQVLQDSQLATQTKKKKVLMLRESIGAFQELDDDEWQSRLEEEQRTQSQSVLSRGTISKVRGSGGVRRERKMLRISQVEVLDLRED